MDYVNFLQGQYRAVIEFERALQSFSSVGIPGHERLQRPKLLQTDLKRLGASSAFLLGKSRIHTIIFENIHQAWGGLYVVEGSALGGTKLKSLLERNLGAGILGALSFVSGYGPQTGNVWQAFSMALNAHIEQNPDAYNDVKIGAEATFNLYIDCFSIEKYASRVTRGVQETAALSHGLHS